jgi:hypothetical protein
MRGLTVALALAAGFAAGPSQMRCQDPAAAKPASPVDSSAGKKGMTELRLAAFTMPSRRSVGIASSSVVYNASPAFSGVEFLVRSIDGGAGLHLRYATASPDGAGLASYAMKYLDGRLLLGSRGFSVELGYLLRTETIAGKDSTHGFARAGFRTDINLGSSGITAGVAASYLRLPEADSLGNIAWGIDGETSVLYALPMAPVYVQLGYRRETYTFEYKKSPSRPEQISTLFLGVGFHLGLR